MADCDQLRHDGSTPTRARPDQRGTVHVFRHDPDLLDGLDDPTTALLTRRVTTRSLELPCGTWLPPAGRDGVLGLLVLEGLLIRSIRPHGKDCPELLGAGDLLRPWDADADSDADDPSRWRVLQPTTVAILDDRFALIAGRWPSIMSGLFARGAQRSRNLVFHLTLANIRQAEARLQILLWHLADRWGQVTPEGVRLPLPLTHELLGQLACMQRPTASTTLQRMTRSGEIRRGPDRGWTLLGRPPNERAECARSIKLAA